MNRKLRYLQHRKDFIRGLIIKHRIKGDDEMVNKFEAMYSKLDAEEHNVREDKINDIMFSRLTKIWDQRIAVMIAENVHNQTEAKKLTVLSKPDAVEALGKENVQLYFRQMLTAA